MRVTTWSELGQREGGPSGVASQSKLRRSVPISPPPARNPAASEIGCGAARALLMGAVCRCRKALNVSPVLQHTRGVNPARRNVLLLACAQALLLTNAVTLIAIGALAGYQLAPAKALATLPSFAYIVGAAIATIPASLWMRRVGRRNGFLSGGAVGLVGSVIATAGVGFGSFTLLCLGSALLDRKSVV